MQIISGTTDFNIQEPTAIVLGKFDGVHVGHQILLDKLLDQKDKGLKTVVFTFDKSPASLFIQDGDAYREICTLNEKREIFEKMGIDILIEFPMNEETAKIPASEFVTEILQNKLNCNILIAGEDVSFGYKGLGDSSMLAAHSRDGGFHADILEKVYTSDIFPDEEDEEIASTIIRRDITLGKIARANNLMNRPFQISGEVVKGNQLGNAVFQMPTANVIWPKTKILPAFGVYFTEIIVDESVFPAITNVGIKPTIEVQQENPVLAESYLYHFDEDIYGKSITIKFYEYSRPEHKFDSFDALKEQLSKDLEAGLIYWNIN